MKFKYCHRFTLHFEKVAVNVAETWIYGIPEGHFLCSVWYLLMLFVLHSDEVPNDGDVGEHPLERFLLVRTAAVFSSGKSFHVYF